MKFMAGIDEAGRGAVLGPLVMGIVVAGEEGIKNLAALGVKDSKQLTRGQREKIFNEMYSGNVGLAHMSWTQCSPMIIDSTNLNRLELMMAKELVNSVYCTDDMEFIIDDFTNGKWKDLNLPSFIRFEIKADQNHIVVGAASIIAKVIRDRLLDMDLKANGLSECSGYPSDNKTVDTITEYYKTNKKMPKCARASWKTCKQISESVNAKI